MFSSGLLQDVAYGVSKIKYDSGDTQTVPHTVLTTKYSHTIQLYLDLCKEVNYIPVSESTLWRILKALKPSQRRSLAGLDDITAAGMNGFSFLDKTVKDISGNNCALVSKLEKGKRYLKLSYQLHCSESTNIASHNPNFALTPTSENSIFVSDEMCQDCYDLFSVIQDINELCVQKGNAELIYDVNNAIKDIVNYVKHLMRDHQQKKAKTHCFDQLDNETAFWLRDFAQKILPVKYREGQREYFGKKGMSLHIDVIFRKVDSEIEKDVYLTCLYRCSQSMVDVHCIAEKVLQEFHNDYPIIKNIFCKSDNASCYHGNYVLEALYKLAKHFDISLMRYDYNEPCRGKDQCDRESSGIKTILNSFVDAGNDVISADDLYESVHYGNGVKKGKISVAEIDADVSNLSGKKITNISDYHSVKFCDNHMYLYRYYDIGEGIKVSYTGTTFNSGLRQIKTFHRTDKPTAEHSGKKKKLKPRKDREICQLFFCPEPTCSQVFDLNIDLESHLLSENHQSFDIVSGMDQVRNCFFTKMKSSSQLHMPILNSNIEVSDQSFQYTIQSTTSMQFFSNPGWALPVRSKFRYNYRQKKLLYKYFMEGEVTGKKKNPEEVEKLLRKDLIPNEYVTVQQIRSLFSRWAKEHKNGKLTEPREADTSDNDVEEINRSKPDDAEYAMDLAEEVNEVLANICNYEVNDWIAIKYLSNWHPGQITKIMSNGRVEIKLMTYGINRERNRFVWPEEDLILQHLVKNILLHVEAPVPVGTRYFRLTDTDFKDASHLFLMH